MWEDPVSGKSLDEEHSVNAAGAKFKLLLCEELVTGNREKYSLDAAGWAFL